MRRLFVFSTVLGMMFGLLSVTSMPALGNHDPDVIHACIKNSNGQLRAVSDPSQCASSDTPIELQKAGCPADMVKVGDFCIDKYEAHVVDSNGIPKGTSGDDYPCSDNGNDCSDPSQPNNMIFVRSVAGVTPSAFITWFQAQQACANVGKRLPTNAEWQMAAAGTPDPGTDDEATDCNLIVPPGPGITATGSRSKCVSNFGAFDMVGNLWEWVADWMQDNSGFDAGDISTAEYGLDRIIGIDEATPEGDEFERFPTALSRGGRSGDVITDSGVFALDASNPPSTSGSIVGFRCARNR
jgi:formylglycine-generating enzyme required for sulfatase activity